MGGPGTLVIATLNGRTRVAMRPGVPVRIGTVEERPLVERGALVEVIARSGGLVVKHRGIAMQSGTAGQVIAIKNEKSKKKKKNLLVFERASAVEVLCIIAIYW